MTIGAAESSRCAVREVDSSQGRARRAGARPRRQL